MLGSIVSWGDGKVAYVETPDGRGTVEVRGPNAGDRTVLFETPGATGPGRIDADPTREHLLLSGSEGTWRWSRRDGLVRIGDLIWPSW